MKKLLLGLLSALFSLCIITLAVTTSFNSVFGRPDTLKTTLQQSKVYDSLAASVGDNIAKNAQAETGLPAENPLVQNAITKVITPQKLQGYSEQAIDGTYSWLEGKTETPNYQLDLASLQGELGASAGDAAAQHVQTLPVCTLAQLRQLDPATADPFSLPCQPPNVNIAAERQKVVNELTANNTITEDNTLTAQDATDEQGQNVFQNLAYIPVVFQWSKFLPWVAGVLAIAAGAAIVFLYLDRRQGIKLLAKMLVITGVILLIGIWLGSFVLGKARPDVQAGSTSVALQDSVVTVMRSLNRALNRTLLVFAIVYTLAGAGGLIGLYSTRPKHAMDASLDKPDPRGVKAPPEPKETPKDTDANKPPAK